jgi:hypothetical protein
MPIEVSKLLERMADAPLDPHAALAPTRMAVLAASELVGHSVTQMASRAASQMAGLAWSQMGSQAARLAVTQAASLAASQATNTIKSLQESLRAQEEDRNERLGAALAWGAGAQMRREAEERALALQQRDTLQQVRQVRQAQQQSEAAARRYFWKGVAATILVGALLTFAGWLLTALNAGQVLSALFHR